MKKRKKMTVLIVTVAAMMIALQIIFERFLSISTPMYRVGFTFIVRALAGFSFGILAGGLYGIGVCGFCSLAADLIGTMMFYPSINPLISVAALFRGLLFGFSYKKKEPSVVSTVFTVLADQFIGGFVITSLGLVLFGGVPSTGLFWFGRAVQALFLAIVEIPVLYFFNTFVFPRIRAYLNANGMNHADQEGKRSEN